MEIIKTGELSFTYKNEEDSSLSRAVDEVTLDIKKGEFVSVLGRNGSGKSTLAKLFNALLLPDEGYVYVYSYDTSDKTCLWEIRKTVGMVFQNPDNQIIGTTVEEDVAFGPENMGMESSLIRQRVDESLRIVGLSDYSKKEPHMLSGGQKQRTAIAGILAIMPDVIVLDEATSMLDPVGRKEIMKIVKKLNKEEGITIINITHIMEETVDSDRIVILDKGRVSCVGTPREVFKNVEEIREMGLDVPQITDLFYELRKEGICVRDDVLTPEEGMSCIREMLRWG
jgi:energy-coupling factor transport system ATP-binding protein